MDFNVINKVDIKELETLLIRDGKINCLPYSKFSGANN